MKQTDRDNSELNLGDKVKGYEYYLLGKDFYEKKQDEKAIEGLIKALKLGYNDADLFCILGHSLQLLGKNDQALPFLNESIKLFPYNCNTFFIRSFAKQGSKDFDGAIADLERAVEISEYDNDMNNGFHEGARTLGWESATHLYKSYLNQNKDMLSIMKEINR